MASSSSRTRSRSPFSHRRPPSPYSSASSTCSSHMNNRLLPRSSSTSASTVYNSAGASGSRSMATSRTVSDPGLVGGSGNYKPPSPVPYASDGVISEPMSTTTSDRHSISVTVRFRPMRYARSGPPNCRSNLIQFLRNETRSIFPPLFVCLIAVRGSIKEEMKSLGILTPRRWSGMSTIPSQLMHSVLLSIYCRYNSIYSFTVH